MSGDFARPAQYWLLSVLKASKVWTYIFLNLYNFGLALSIDHSLLSHIVTSKPQYED